MTKYMLWYTAVPGKQGELQEWLNTRFADTVLHSTSGVTSFRVNLAVPEPDGSELLPPSETSAADPCDAIVEVTYVGGDGMATLFWLNQLVRRALIQSCHVYEVEESQVLDTFARKPGLPSRGFRLIQGFSFFAQVPDREGRPRWRGYEDLAVGDHDEPARSIRVRRTVTSGSPELQSVSVIRFPTSESPGVIGTDSRMGKGEITNDLPAFMYGRTRQIFASFTREFVFLSEGERVGAEPWSMWPMP